MREYNSTHLILLLYQVPVAHTCQSKYTHILEDTCIHTHIPKVMYIIRLNFFSSQFRIFFNMYFKLL